MKYRYKFSTYIFMTLISTMSAYGSDRYGYGAAAAAGAAAAGGDTYPFQPPQLDDNAPAETEKCFDYTPEERIQNKKLMDFLLEDFQSEADALKDQDKLFVRLKLIRDGNAVKGIGGKDKTALLVQYIYLTKITSRKEDLDQRAALTLANATVALVENNHVPPLQHSKFLQDAFYLYSLLAERGNDIIKHAATNNRDRLLLNKQFQDQKQPNTLRQVRPVTAVEMLKIEYDKILEGLSLATNRVFDAAKKTSINIGQAMAKDLLANSDEQVSQDDIDRYVAQINGLVIEKGTDGAKQIILQNHQQQALTIAQFVVASSMQGREMITLREAEESQAAGKVVPTIPVPDSVWDAMFNLLAQIYILKIETPLLGEKVPLIVPIGRSVSWLFEMHELIEPELQTGIEMRHILASGLSKYEPTPDQKEGYKRYLSSKGFDDLDNREIILLDVCDTGQTLRAMKDLLPELFPELAGRIQSISILYEGTTSSVPCTRVVRMNDPLKGIIFAKHAANRFYNPHPMFFPDEWVNGGPSEDFKVDPRATLWRKKLKTWTESEHAQRHMQEIMGAVKSLHIDHEDDR